MKTKAFTILTAALLAPLALHAEPDAPGKDKDGPRGERGPRQLPAEVIAKFDKDGDGKLNDEERKAAREAGRAMREEMRARFLKKFDADKDGKLNDEERKAAREAHMAKFDTDGDGKLSKEERRAARKEMRKHHRRGPGGPEGKDRKGPRGEKPEKE